MRDLLERVEKWGKDDDDYGDDEETSPDSSFLPYDELMSNRPIQSQMDLYLNRASESKDKRQNLHFGSDPHDQNNPMSKLFPGLTMKEERERMEGDKKSKTFSVSGSGKGGILARKRALEEKKKEKKNKVRHFRRGIS